MATTSQQQWGLAPDQQRLLLAALQSNKRKLESNTRSNSTPAAINGDQSSSDGPAAVGIQPSMLSNLAPAVADDFANGDDSFGSFDFGASDPGFDFDVGASNTDLVEGLTGFSGDTAGGQGEKRKSSDDNLDLEDDEEDDKSGPKRRQGDERGSKKPGRKPSTSEPTTKRKAQNRAAQRAFRDRKEKHLKDLETKVTDLEKASESANHENSVLRSQVDRLQDELKDYRRRMSLTDGGIRASPPTSRSSNTAPKSSSNGFDFNFDFERFGSTPVPQQPVQRSVSNHAASPPQAGNRSQSNGGSPQQHRNRSIHSETANSNGRLGAMRSVYGNGSFNDDAASNFGLPSSTSPQPLGQNGTQATNGAYNHPSPSQCGSGASSRSPGESHLGQTSSYGTSPCTSPDENWANDYHAKNNKDGFSVANTTPSLINDKTPSSDINNFDWLASQNGGQFDPVLFGDYRESQDNILGTGDFSGGFFDDSLPSLGSNDLFNFGMPSMAATSPQQAAQAPAKQMTNLMEQVERQRDGADTDERKVVAEGEMIAHLENKATKMMSCPQVWESLRSSATFQSGDFDVDALCSDLTSKARCTESGLSLPRESVEAVLWKLATQDKQAAGGRTQ